MFFYSQFKESSLSICFWFWFYFNKQILCCFLGLSCSAKLLLFKTWESKRQTKFGWILFLLEILLSTIPRPFSTSNLLKEDLSSCETPSYFKPPCLNRFRDECVSNLQWINAKNVLPGSRKTPQQSLLLNGILKSKTVEQRYIEWYISILGYIHIRLSLDSDIETLAHYIRA